MITSAYLKGVSKSDKYHDHPELAKSINELSQPLLTLIPASGVVAGSTYYGLKRGVKYLRANPVQMILPALTAVRITMNEVHKYGRREGIPQFILKRIAERGNS